MALRTTLLPSLSGVIVACALACALPFGCSDQTVDGTTPAAGGHDGGASDGGGSKDGGSTGDASSSDGGGGGEGGGGGGSLAFTDAVSVIVEPSDKGTALLDAIQGAKKSVHMTMYLLSDSYTINALIARHTAGVEVKVVLDPNFPAGDKENDAAFNKLKSAGVDVVYASSARFQYVHEKCVILDGATAWIMTMNATYSAPTANREYLAVDTDGDDVAEAEAIFQADYADKPITPSGKLVVAPTNATSEVVALIQSATKTIELESEELSDSSVVNALTARADAGVTVHVVLANAGSSQQQQAIATLKQHKAQVVSIANPYVHAKAIVVDGARMYVGSANFTTPSLQENRELGILTATSSEVQKVQTTIGTDVSNGQSL